MKEKTKVLFLTNSLAVGGAEMMLVNLVNRFDQEQFAITIISLHENNSLLSKILPHTADFFSLPRKWHYDLSPAREIARIIQERGIRKILTFGLFEYFFAFLATRQMPDPPNIIISVHSTLLEDWKSHLQHLLYARLISSSSSSPRLVAVCNAQADYWMKTYFIPRKRFTTIYNGVDVNHFALTRPASARETIRAQYNIPTDATVLIQVASFGTHKRHEDAFQALQYLSSHFPQIKCYLMLVGGGSPAREQELRQAAETLHLADQIVFCGVQDDVRPFLQAADIFTLTSAAIETFSVAALEAMSSGLPCVLTDVSGAKEMIVEAMNGFLVKAKQPEDIATGWARAIISYKQFNPAAIRQHVIDRFSIHDCVQMYQEIMI